MSMKGGLQNKRGVVAAAVLALAFVGGAYMLARGFGAPQVAQASTETALLQQLATRDSTGDGLPDWEKTLYGIPLNATTTDYFHLGMTDGEAVAKGLIVPKAVAEVASSTPSAIANPSMYTSNGLTPPTSGTLTDLFTQQFLSLYAQARQANNGAPLSSAQTDALTNQLMTQFMNNLATRPDFKTAADLTIAHGASGASALRTYAESAAAVMRAYLPNPVPKGTQIWYLQNYLTTGNKDDLAELNVIAKYYREVATGLAALPVPSVLAPDTLALVNAMMRVSQMTDALAHANTDELTAALSLEEYNPSTQSLEAAFIGIANTYATMGVTFATTDPGAFFADFLAAQAAK